MSTEITADAHELPFCCGAVVLGNFDRSKYSGDPYLIAQISRMKLNHSYAYVIATFINEPECKEAYEELCKEMKLVMQTEPKRNPKTGNKVFVAVFTRKGK